MEIICNKNNIYGTEIKSYNDFIYKKSIVKNILWDEEIVNEVLKYVEDGDILDIGANIGLIALGVIKKAKEQNKIINNIHCFECDNKLIPLLLSNISPFDNIKLYPFAVSDRQELCNITSLELNMGCNYIYTSKDENSIREYDYSKLFYTPAHIRNNNIFILGVALDSILYQFKNRISVIKIDVEGFELKVLNGAKQLIQKYNPVIIVEIFESINFINVLYIFQELGYKRFKKINNNIYKNEDYIFFPN